MVTLASTGLAAARHDGITLHSYLGATPKVFFLDAVTHPSTGVRLSR
jgi:hypothetical protein